MNAKRAAKPEAVQQSVCLGVHIGLMAKKMDNAATNPPMQSRITISPAAGPGFPLDEPFTFILNLV